MAARRIRRHPTATTDPAASSKEEKKEQPFFAPSKEQPFFPQVVAVPANKGEATAAGEEPAGAAPQLNAEAQVAELPPQEPEPLADNPQEAKAEEKAELVVEEPKKEEETSA